MRPVLLVDDSALVRRVLAQKLAAVGLTVCEEDSVARGSQARVLDIACAVLDLELGDGDGVAIAAALRARDPRLPIAFFSGGADAPLLARARALGPVFAKGEGESAVVAWALAAARDRSLTP